MAKPVLLALVSVITVWVITAGVAFAATVFQKSLNASVNIVAEAAFEFYSDGAATHPIANVSLGDVSPDETSTFTVYLKNTSTSTETISAGSNTVPASVGTLTLKFDGQTQKNLAPGAITKIVGTLNVDDDATPGPINFSFSVKAVPATTSSLPTTPVVSGQQLFNTYCTSCHSLPNTNRTQTQLISFISGHNTGKNLTAEEIVAIASFIKP